MAPRSHGSPECLLRGRTVQESFRSACEHSPGPMRVLVVEDDSDLRRLRERGLAEEGYELEMASTGHDALAAAQARPPAMIVLDIGLPDTDGRDLCQALRTRGVMAPVLF